MAPKSDREKVGVFGGGGWMRSGQKIIFRQVSRPNADWNSLRYMVSKI